MDMSDQADENYVIEKDDATDLYFVRERVHNWRGEVLKTENLLPKPYPKHEAEAIRAAIAVAYGNGYSDA